MAKPWSEIKHKRILRAHLCSEDQSRCTDPEAHFQGTDEEWQELIERSRKDARQEIVRHGEQLELPY